MINHIAKTTLFASQVMEIEVVFVAWDWKDLIVLCVSLRKIVRKRGSTKSLKIKYEIKYVPLSI